MRPACWPRTRGRRSRPRDRQRTRERGARPSPVENSVAGLSIDGTASEEIDRHVDRARDTGHLARRQPAGIVEAVGKDHDRAAAALACRDALSHLGDRIVQRRGAEGRHGRHRLGKRPEAARERRDLVEPRVEREDRRLVARAPASSKGGSPPRARSASVCSMLPLTSNSRATLTPARLTRKSEMGLSLPLIHDLEILCRQILHETAPVIADHGRHPHQVDAGLEGRHRRLALRLHIAANRDRPRRPAKFPRSSGEGNPCSRTCIPSVLPTS